MYRLLSVLAAASLLGACAGGRQDMADDRPLIPALAPYRMDIRQGNVVDAAMLARLQLGMERARAHPDRHAAADRPLPPGRWDYTFTERKGYEQRAERTVTLVFEGDRLARVEGDVLPVAGAREKNLLTASTRTTVDVPAEIESQGRLARLLGGGERKKPGRRDLARFVETEEARQYETVEGGEAKVPATDTAGGAARPAGDDEGQGIFDGLLGQNGH